MLRIMSSSITLKDIAKALNLSVSTISRALNDSYQIGEETKQLVLDYANAHHYVPNRMARSLKEGKTRTIGVVICSIDNYFFAQMLDGIDQVCKEKGYQLIIMQSKDLYEQEKACVHYLYASGTDGLMISPSYQTSDFSHLSALQDNGFPIVLFDRISKSVEAHQIASNNFKGAYEATQHLISQGYHRIAHINTTASITMPTARFEGYKQALEDNQIPYREQWVKFCETVNEQDVETALTELMAQKEKPQAIFAATDSISTHMLRYFNKHGYKIPEDIALIGFNNTELADMLNPSLSTVQQPSQQIGSVAAKTLIDLVEGRDLGEPTTILLDTTLHPRKSSGC